MILWYHDTRKHHTSYNIHHTSYSSRIMRVTALYTTPFVLRSLFSIHHSVKYYRSNAIILVLSLVLSLLFSLLIPSWSLWVFRSCNPRLIGIYSFTVAVINVIVINIMIWWYNSKCDWNYKSDGDDTNEYTYIVIILLIQKLIPKLISVYRYH